MTTKQKTIIVTGASQGIGAAVANLFLDRGYNVVGNSRKISQKNELQRSDKLALVDGDIGLASTAGKIVGTAVERFGSVDALVNNAGIFFTKPFTEYTPEDFRALSSTNLDGFIHTTQSAVTQMLSQKSGGSVVSITTSIVDHPLAGVTASVPMITKGGIDAISRSLAMEYAPQGIRVKRGGSRRRGYADAQEQSQGVPSHAVAPRACFECQGYRGGRVLSHRGEPGHRRGAAR